MGPCFLPAMDILFLSYSKSICLLSGWYIELDVSMRHRSSKEAPRENTPALGL